VVRDGLAFPLGVAHAAAFSLKPSSLSFFLVYLHFFGVGSTLPFFADQDLAQYLFDTLPREWLNHHQISSTSKIVDVLQKLHGHSSLENRVDQALLVLGLLPT
jgi:hypothetical protein